MKWVVKKGEHRFNPFLFRLHRGKTCAVWEVKFNKTNLYDPGFEDDWNKLCGWSYGLLPGYDHEIFGKGWFPAHHNNSIRIGWRPIDSLHQIELAIYVYENEERKVSSEKLYVPIDRTFKLMLSYSAGFVRLQKQTNDDHNIRSISMPYNGRIGWGYMLNPFFGGSSPCPIQTMHLDLTQLN